MYSNNKAVALLVAMLKEKKIQDIVVSAGTSHDAIARSLEEDEFFHTYHEDGVGQLQPEQCAGGHETDQSKRSDSHRI